MSFMDKAKTKLYKKHLKRVSRSFAFCIEELDEPSSSYVGLSYILCRLLDTIEDSEWSNVVVQKEAFTLFNQFLLQAPDDAEVRRWQKLFTADLVEGEALLLKDAQIFFQDFACLPESIRLKMLKPIQSMSSGMAYFADRFSGTDAIKLKSQRELDWYCLFVAGVVGELLTDVFSEVHPEFVLQEQSRVNAINFGLFLQKINILKDQMTDESEGRFFISDREETMSSLQRHAKGTLSYILDIPSSLKGYRIFCSWSFFLGLYSLPYIEKSWEVKKKYKISKTKMFLYLDKIKKNISDDQFLKDEFDRYFPLDKRKSENREKLAGSGMFQELYQGKLSSSELSGLGLS